MKVDRETYTELAHSMIFAYAGQQLNMAQVASVLYACAQSDTEQEVTDITHKVREALTDWSEMDKGMLIAIETVKMTFKCVNIHGPCKKGEHAVNMTRVIGSMDWEPEQVTSIHDFNDVILDAMEVPRHDDGSLDGKLVTQRGKGRRSDLIGAFRDMFMQQPEQTIEKEIDEFRSELDKLFPSAPSTPQEKGGNDDS